MIRKSSLYNSVDGVNYRMKEDNMPHGIEAGSHFTKEQTKPVTVSFCMQQILPTLPASTRRIIAAQWMKTLQADAREAIPFSLKPVVMLERAIQSVSPVTLELSQILE